MKAKSKKDNQVIENAKNKYGYDELIEDFFYDIEEYGLSEMQKETLEVKIYSYVAGLRIYKEDKKLYDNRNVNVKSIIKKAIDEIVRTRGDSEDYRKYLKAFFGENINKIESEVRNYETTLYFLRNFAEETKYKPVKPTIKSLKLEIINYFKENTKIKKEISEKILNN